MPAPTSRDGQDARAAHHHRGRPLESRQDEGRRIALYDDGERHQRSYTESRYRETQTGRLVHLDVAGPLLESKIRRFKYLMLLIDDSSRFRIATPMRSREEASAKIRGFVSRFNALAAASGGRIARVGSLLSDGAKELVSNELQEYLDDNGADKKESPPGVDALNGCAERGILAVF